MMHSAVSMQCWHADAHTGLYTAVRYAYASRGKKVWVDDACRDCKAVGRGSSL